MRDHESPNRRGLQQTGDVKKTLLSPKKLKPDLIGSFIQSSYPVLLTSLPELMQGGTENAGWLLDSGKVKYVAKLFSGGYKVINVVNEEIHLYDFLRDNSINIPEVITTNTGTRVSNFMAEGSEYPVVLMRLEKLHRASPSTITHSEIESIAETIARMHKALFTYPRKNKLSNTQLPQSLSVSSSGFADLIASPNGSIFSPQELNDIQQIESKSEGYINTRKISKSLRKGVLHGDLSLGHAQFLPNGEVYLFDFSDFSVGPIMWELATLFVYFYKEGGVTFDRWKKMTKQFLNKYKQTVAIKQDDITALKYCLIDRLLFETRTLNSISKRDNRPVDSAGNRNRYKLIDYLLDSAGNLSSDFNLKTH